MAHEAVAVAPEKDINWYLQNYQMESVAIVLLVGAIVMMFLGKS